MLAKIMNLLSDAWQQLRTLWVGMGEVIKKLSGSAMAFFGSAAAIGKIGFDKVSEYINTFMDKLQAMDGLDIEATWTGMEYIGVANKIFPLEELITVLIMLAEFWVFCLIFKMNWHFRRQIRLG